MYVINNLKIIIKFWGLKFTRKMIYPNDFFSTLCELTLDVDFISIKNFKLSYRILKSTF